MIKCPKCTDGKMPITVIHGLGPEARTESMTLECVYCDGNGEITEVKAEELRRMNDVWCKCPEPGDPIFVDDSPECKHHWDCAKCGGLIQIG